MSLDRRAHSTYYFQDSGYRWSNKLNSESSHAHARHQQSPYLLDLTAFPLQYGVRITARPEVGHVLGRADQENAGSEEEGPVEDTGALIQQEH
jgi:hypothetical protein